MHDDIRIFIPMIPDQNAMRFCWPVSQIAKLSQQFYRIIVILCALKNNLFFKTTTNRRLRVINACNSIIFFMNVYTTTVTLGNRGHILTCQFSCEWSQKKLDCLGETGSDCHL